jgi:hypothetical protein
VAAIHGRVGATAGYAGPLAGPCEVLQADQAGSPEAFAATAAISRVVVAVPDAKTLV